MSEVTYEIPFDANIIIDDRYCILKKIGQGGMGCIYLVRDLLVKNRILALKTIRPSILKKESKYIDNELKNEYLVMTKLKHPNLTTVYGYGKDKSRGVSYIAMEYLSGITLRVLLKQGAISIDLTLDIFVNILRTLEFIHSRNIVYRDLKPENIIIELDEDRKLVSLKLLDFGLSDLLLTQDKFVKGTIYYMAPEVFRKKSIDYRADIFAAGLIFYELLSGKRLYSGKNHKSVVSLLGNHNFFKENINLNINLKNSFLNLLIKKMIAYYAHDRFSCCTEIITIINSHYNKRYMLETLETKEAYVSGVNYIKRDGLNVFFKQVLNSKKPQLHLLEGKIGYGKSMILDKLIHHCQLNNILYYKNYKSGVNDLVYKPFIGIINKMLFKADIYTLNKYGSQLKNILPDHPLLAAYSNVVGNFDISKDFIVVRIMSDFIIDFIKQYKKQRIKSNKSELLFIIDDIHKLNKASIRVIKNILSKLIYNKLNFVTFVASCETNYPINSKYIQNLKFKKRIKEYVLTPLSNDEIKRYLEAVFGEKKIDKSLLDNCDKLNHRVGGVPQFLTEYIKTLVNNNKIIRTAKQWKLVDNLQIVDLPITVTDLLQETKKSLNLSDRENDIVIFLYIFNSVVSLEQVMILNEDKSSDEIHKVITSLLNNQLLSFKNNKYRIENELIYNSYVQSFDDKKIRNIYCSFLHNLINLCIDESSLNIDQSRKEYSLLSFFSKKFLTFMFDKSIEFIDDTKFYDILIDSLIYTANFLNLSYLNKIAVTYFEILRQTYKNGLRFASGQKYDDAFLYLDFTYKSSICYKNIGKLDRLKQCCSEIINYPIILSSKFYKLYFDTQYLLGELYTNQDKFEKVENILFKIQNSNFKYSRYEIKIIFYLLKAELFLKKNNYSESLIYAKKLLAVIKTKKSDTYYCQALSVLGKIYLALNRLVEAKSIFLQVNKIAIQNKDIIMLSKSTANLGIVNYNQGYMIKANFFFQKFLNFAKKTGVKRNIMIAYLNLTLTVKDKKMAIFYNKYVLQLAKELNNRYVYYTACNNLATKYLYFHEYKKAYKFYSRSYTGLKRINNQGGVFLAGGNIALMYIKIGNMKKAEKFILEQFNLSKEKSNVQYKGVSLINLAILYESQFKWSSALNYVNQAIDILVKYKDFVKLTISLHLKALILGKQGDFKKAKKINDDALLLLDNLKDEEVDFKVRLLDQKLRLATAGITGNKFRKNLHYLSKFKTNILFLAEINYEIFKVTLNNETGIKSLMLYQILYERSDYKIYQNKVESLKFMLNINN